MGEAIAVIGPTKGSWVQTEREAHVRWSRLTVEHPIASGILHFLVSKAGKMNAVAASHTLIAEQLGISRASVKRGARTLAERGFIEVLRMGATGSVNVYVLDSNVSWSDAGRKPSMSELAARVLVSRSEQEVRTCKTSPR